MTGDEDAFRRRSGMTSTGLAHRPAQEFVADWTDAEAERRDEDASRDAADDRRGAELPHSSEPAPSDRRSDAVDGIPDRSEWFSGEPMS
jgi:hypothetical protein